jgi:hypothetical protein
MDYIYGNTIVVFEKSKERILKLLDADFKDEAIVLTTTICEVLLKDFCKTCRSVWIHNQSGHTITNRGIHKTKEYKIKIRNYLTSINAYDNFLKSLYVHQGGPSQDPDADALYDVLFGMNDHFINFQNLNEKKANKGAIKAYEFLFNINLKDNLHSDKETSHKKYENLLKLIGERHKIAHRGASSRMRKDEIKDVILSLDYLKVFLVRRIQSYYIFHDF